MESHKKMPPSQTVAITVTDEEGATIKTEDSTFESYDQEEFDKCYGKVEKEPQTIRQLILSKKENCCSSCSKDNLVDFVFRIFPCLTMFRTYKFKKYMLGDIVAGLSIGVLQVPQGMGYALLASVPPIIGLYTSFFPVFVYFILGTGRHVSIGCVALASMIIRDVIKRETVDLELALEEANFNDTELSQLLEHKQISIAVTMTMLAGLMSVAMGILNLGFLTTYIGESMMAGFLTGANMRVVTSQVFMALQYQTKTHVGQFSFIYTLFDMARALPTINVASLIISVISISILAFVKYFINVRFIKVIRFPLPIDLVVVTIGTIASHFANFEERFGVRIVKEVPRGVPRPTIPSFELAPKLIVDSFMLALVSYVLMFMLAKLFSHRHNYKIDPNQEWLAMGFADIVGSFFSCIAVSTSTPRCFLMESTGGKTQISHIFSALVVLMTLFFMAPLLNSLPICILASLVIASCIPLFEQYKKCAEYWRTNKWDFSIWLVTLAATVFWSISMGIIIGVVFSFITIVLRTQKPYSYSATSLMGTTITVNQDKYSKNIKETLNVKIFSFKSPIYFSTIDIFTSKLQEATMNPQILKTKIAKKNKQPIAAHQLVIEEIGSSIADIQVMIERSNNSIFNKQVSIEDDELTRPQPQRHRPLKDIMTPLTLPPDDSSSSSSGSSTTDDTTNNIHAVIVDCSGVPFIDTAGSKRLASLHGQFDDVNTTFALAGCNDVVIGQLKKVATCRDLLRNLYPSVWDAVQCLTNIYKTEKA